MLVSMDDVILRTRDLRREFGGFCAVDGVNLEVRVGHIHAIIGPNGAGKTTMFNLLTKFLAPSSGQILLEGVDITRVGPAHVASLGMVRSFQISSVFGRLTALQNVRIALMRLGTDTFRFWRTHRELECYNERAVSM